MNEDDIKIHLACKNVFLTLSLGFYLKGHLSTIDSADFVITDSLETKEKFSHIPMCLVGSDLRIPCSVYEIFSQLHDFYKSVNAKQAQIFQKDMHQMRQSEIKQLKNTKIPNSKVVKKDVVEEIKQTKMKELLSNANPALHGQIELLFDELSQKIYDTINKKEKNSI